MLGHIIVCGDDALAMRIVEELNNSGATVLTVQTPDGLAAAGLAEAQAVICVADDDDRNLEIALLARQASPDVRVVARLANGVLRDYRELLDTLRKGQGVESSMQSTVAAKT